MDLPQAIARVVDGQSLTGPEMHAVMSAIMHGHATQAQIGALLVGLRMKGETVDEVAAAATVMRGLATPVAVQSRDHLIDTCGTGGDGLKTVNISTGAAFVVAAGGGHVAKHGNRSVSSRSGSADVLEAAGVRLDLSPSAVGRCIDEVGVGFMFAPSHHKAMQHAMGPRRELGIRTLFNLLGPLTNPAGAPRQLCGVFHPRLVPQFASVLRILGSEHALVVHGRDGMDEISLSGATWVAELRAGDIQTYEVTPAEFGFTPAPIAALAVTDPADSLAKLLSALSDEPGPVRDVITLNAGAGLYVAGLAGDLREGVARARELIRSGAARSRVAALVSKSLELGTVA